ncbi:hypothetical protein GCM10011391_32220 [Pullulanibacillus camelliae]|uniref:RNA polymerase sigma-70 region 2 domain-containing protein n=1 Tax=Pullulanibacillus camelliae TaxID=1707096 RepID=A0A8J3DZA0_9BACL|nr:sigma-70 family RNA polymerase sigma factor [Pullulanibacillus camelliae]GGE51005.1 hypothetical protein GCM10011391_32220 [Pullulanibacillus camelliae]
MIRACSFEDIATRFDPLIKKWLISYQQLRDYDEMYQIALIALWEAVQQFDPKKGAFPAYAALMVRGKLLTEIKRKKRYASRHLFFETFPEFPIVQEVDTLEVGAFQYMTWLSDRERLWIKEAVLRDKETAIIAAEQGVTMDTVRSWKKAALAKLKKRLKTEA